MSDCIVRKIMTQINSFFRWDSMSRLTRYLFFLLFPAVFFLPGCMGSVPAGKVSQMPGDSLSSASRDLFVAGAFSAAKKDYAAAIAHYKKVLAVQPENPAILFSLSKAFVGLREPDSARYYGEQAVSYSPSNKYYRRQLAGIYFDMKMFPEAALQFERLAEMEPTEKRHLFYLAHAYLADEKYEEALGVFSRILEFDPENENAQVQALWLELKLKRYGAAIYTLESLMENNGNDDKLQLTLGELYFRSGKVDKAVEIFKNMVDEKPAFIPAWVALFEAYIEQGEQERFLLELKRFYAVEEIDVSRKIELAKLFIIRAEKEEAYWKPAGTMVGELVMFRPDDPSVYVIRGVYHLGQKKFARATGDFQKALDLDSQNSFAWEELASAFMSQEQYLQVLYTVKQAKKSVGRSSQRLEVMKGFALFRLEKYRESVEVLEKVLAFKEGKPSRWLLVQASVTRAMAYDKLRDQVRSIKAYKDVLEIDPENALAWNNLAYLYAERGENLEEAMRFAKQAVDAEPENPVFLDTLGWLYYKTGNYQKARELIEKALSKEPDEPEIYEHLSEILRALGDADKAGEYLEKARELRNKE